MEYPHSVGVLQAGGGLVASDGSFRVVRSSAENSCKDLVVEHHQIPTSEWPNLAYKQHVLAVNVGRAVDCEYKKAGRFYQLWKLTGTTSFFPSNQPCFLRVKMGVNQVADLIIIGLDPKFVIRTAEKLGLDDDNIELVEQRRPYDPTMLHLALVLLEGVRTGAVADPLHSEALATAVTLHLLREYTTARPNLKEGGRNLPRERVLRAVEYIQDQLGKELTVSRIAEAVSMSPCYFTRVFKETTGKSPHQFVIEARVSKAKHLLENGRTTISEAACEVGFVDQSHLTRHFKRMFGLPPKALLRARK